MTNLNRLLEKYLTPNEYQKFKKLVVLPPEKSCSDFIDLDEGIPGPAVAKSLHRRDDAIYRPTWILDIYRPFWKYPSQFTEVLEGSELTRPLIQYCYLHLENTLKEYKKRETRPITGVVRGPLGRLINFVEDKNVLEKDVVSDLKFINDEYLTSMKHEGGFNWKGIVSPPESLTLEEAEVLDNHLFSREDTLSIYFLIRRLVVFLMDKLLKTQLE